MRKYHRSGGAVKGGDPYMAAADPMDRFPLSQPAESISDFVHVFSSECAILNKTTDWKRSGTV